jgi:hypothetical protein
MIFTATRFENTANMRCEADNIVMRNKKEEPLHETLALEVFCEYRSAICRLCRLCFDGIDEEKLKLNSGSRL